MALETTDDHLIICYALLILDTLMKT